MIPITAGYMCMGQMLDTQQNRSGQKWRIPPAAQGWRTVTNLDINGESVTLHSLNHMLDLSSKCFFVFLGLTSDQLCNKINPWNTIQPNNHTLPSFTLKEHSYLLTYSYSFWCFWWICWQCSFHLVLEITWRPFRKDRKDMPIEL